MATLENQRIRLSKNFAARAATVSSLLSAPGGDDRSRTGDPLLAKQMLYQLSYDPEIGGLCCKELLVLDIYFVRSTETRKLSKDRSGSQGFVYCALV